MAASRTSDLPEKILDDPDIEEPEPLGPESSQNLPKIDETQIADSEIPAQNSEENPGAEASSEGGGGEDFVEEEEVPPVLDRQVPEENQGEALDQGGTPPPDLGEAQEPVIDAENEETQEQTGLLAVTIQVGEKKLRLKIVDAPSVPKNETGPLPKKYKPMDHEIPDDLPVDDDEFPSGFFNENPFSCSYCGQNYSSRVKLLRHETEHTGQKPFSCNYCGKGFTHKQSLIMHERIHTGEKPFQCPICTKCFARQTNYNIHMKLHASGRRYFCSFCGKWYRTEHEMLDHQQNCLAQMHGQPVPTDKPLRYQCSYCEKMFHHRRDKNIHERTHTGERPYTCGYCGKGFTQSQALTIHIRTHTGERPYTCAICGKDFRDSSALRKHEFVKHTNLRSSQAAAMYASMEGGEEASASSIMMQSDQLDAAVFAISPNQ